MSTATLDRAANNILDRQPAARDEETARHYITGRTWPVRHQLKESGCRWDFAKKEWYSLDSETARLAQELIDARETIDTPPACSNRNRRQLGLIDQFADTPKPNEDSKPKGAPPPARDYPSSCHDPREAMSLPISPRAHPLRDRIPAYLVGPAGSFKTTTAREASEALGLAFYSTSVCAQTTKSDLLGFIDAGGTYRSTAFRKAYECGGVYLIDEIDNGNANTLAVLNAALANGHMTFPDGEVAKHPDFVLIAAANTFGGATTEYVGRNQLDAATLDRFAVVAFPYDEAMELSLVGCPADSPRVDLAEGGIVEPTDWAQWVITTRKVVADLKLRVVVTPRASLHGAKLASAGIGRAWLERLFIFKTMDRAPKTKILAAAPR